MTSIIALQHRELGLEIEVKKFLDTLLPLHDIDGREKMQTMAATFAEGVDEKLRPEFIRRCVELIPERA